MLVYSLNVFIKIIGFFIKRIYRMVCLKKGQGTQIMSKKKKSRVLVAGICISTLLSPVAFEASKGYAAPLEENKGDRKSVV